MGFLHMHYLGNVQKSILNDLKICIKNGSDFSEILDKLKEFILEDLETQNHRIQAHLEEALWRIDEELKRKIRKEKRDDIINKLREIIEEDKRYNKLIKKFENTN